MAKVTGNPWVTRMAVDVYAAAKKLDVNAYQVGDSTADPAQQVKMIEGLIAKKVDAIIVVPNDAKVLEPVLIKARDQGIVVLTHKSPNQQIDRWDIETIDSIKSAVMQMIIMAIKIALCCFVVALFVLRPVRG